MKMKLLVVFLALAAVLPARANLYTYNFTGINTIIPDAIDESTPGELSDTRTLSGMVGAITDVNVTLNISGGYNGDLYGYLVHDSGFAVLLNRIGRTDTDEFGSSGSGFAVTLDDQAANGDIHLAAYSPNAQLSDVWRPDGRTDDPNDVTQSDANRTALLSSFNDLGANGSWTLFLADMSTGGEGELVSWSLEINTVPEPIGWALIIFGTIVVFWKLLPRHLRRWRDWTLTCG